MKSIDEIKAVLDDGGVSQLRVLPDIVEHIEHLYISLYNIKTALSSIEGSEPEPKPEPEPTHKVGNFYEYEPTGGIYLLRRRANMLVHLADISGYTTWSNERGIVVENTNRITTTEFVQITLGQPSKFRQINLVREDSGTD